MGCKSEREQDVIEEIFSYLPISQVNFQELYSAFLYPLNKKHLEDGVIEKPKEGEPDPYEITITKDDFEGDILNQMLLPQTENETYTEGFKTYWTNYFEKLDQLPTLTTFLVLCMLTNNEKEKENKDTLLYYLTKGKESKKPDEKNEKIMSKEEMKYIISQYLDLITNKTCDLLETIHKNPELIKDFRTRYSKDFTKIQSFVDTYFFKPDEQTIQLEDFLKKYYSILKDQFSLRGEYENYCKSNAQPAQE